MCFFSDLNAGWGPSQLSGELDRKSWYMCATDSQTLLQELARQSKGVDPRDAGLETWELLMGMIGRGEAANECSGSFDDLMLKEWSQANLDDEGGIGLTKSPALGGAEVSTGAVDKLMQEAAQSALSEDITTGTILRASPADRSPFLLSQQELHHSLILVILEDDNMSLACNLSRPATKGCQVTDKSKKVSSIPYRYGGNYAIKDQPPTLWLHCKKKLHESGLGTVLDGVSASSKDIYKCTEDEATSAISYGVAKAEDFLITSGLMVFPKLGGSLASQVKRGMFEVVEPSKIQEVFRILQKQTVLTEDNLANSIVIADEAWLKAARTKAPSSDEADDTTLTVGIGEGFDEDDETIVFNSDKKVSDLAEEALKKWVATFLLGAPTLLN